ncbi:hypothetical protein M409DRAFT_28090 [Zasmidium cellare ATCC 36951]|uniref:T6SS Phospholipase effector Tle1-like catalytic domain-containing protein n=1 Tax=Zasmidium cellare ATCC 36951 TaxID=1080233 RepID=A0A6A6C2X9_ZASCE|nr:uncharacterized protein M409DRAFT_28090 [Zasmidium cellare ATCC 36951]KAF2161355.1 hypothetical protein M409DRAFT_28090 [Zasmidium cellare ATCC 36951]
MTTSTSTYGSSDPASRTTNYEGRQCVPCSYVRASSTLRKRLVACCDGTFCSSDKGKENYATNITRLCRIIANTGLDENKQPITQLVNYQSGVGTGWLTPLNRDLQALGDGLTEKVCEQYNYLVNNYGPGDEIFIFGFSRGSYTARALASFICQIGLLNPGMINYFAEIFNAYKRRDRKTEKDFKHMRWAQEYVRPGELGFDSDCRERWTRYEWIREWAHYHVEVKVVGVFDTVGSIGMSGYVRQPGEDVSFHQSRLHPKIRHAFHALALDESRGNFPPTMFYLDQECIKAGVKLRQCWFPGYHGCVGGMSRAQDDRNSVDEIALAWMIDQLTKENLLQINKRALEYPILNRLATNIRPNDSKSPAPRTPQEANERRIDWSDGKLIDTQKLGWHLASEIATQRWDYVRQPGQYYATEKVNGKTYSLDYTYFDEMIHPCVYHRIKNRDYEPRSMPSDRWSRHRKSNGRGHEWVKYDRNGKPVVRIPEYVIPHIDVPDYGMQHWTSCLEARIAPGDYLYKLDQANGVVRGSSKRPRPVTHDSGYGGGSDEYLSVETLKITTTDRPSSRGFAREYYEGG